MVTGRFISPNQSVRRLRRSDYTLRPRPTRQTNVKTYDTKPETEGVSNAETEDRCVHATSIAQKLLKGAANTVFVRTLQRPICSDLGTETVSAGLGVT